MAGEWVSYREDPADPERLIQHFSGLVLAGLVVPRAETPARNVRDFRYPEDLGVFFHPSCAPVTKLPEQVQDELVELLAGALVADYEKRLERWAAVPCLGVQRNAARCRALVASAGGRRVFTMTRSEWDRLRVQEGLVVEIDLERALAGSLAEAASAIASLAAECSVHTERIEVWRHQAKDRPSPSNVQTYLVLTNLTRRIDVPKFAERAATHDSQKLRKYLRDNLFLVKAEPDKGRWEPKRRTLERIIFMPT